MYGAFSDIALPVAHAVSKGDRVLLHLCAQGTHTDDLDGASTTGERIDAEVMDLFRVEGDRLIEYRALMDNLTMLKQIGMMSA